ncbi:MAG: formylglycine-generating enzyme family protein [Akkermansiaceae bacterium]|nr:formylglycine-generating enzyme family protein [Akkermansiaceae bacterium]
MKTIVNHWIVGGAVIAAVAALSAAQPAGAAGAASPAWHFECSGGVPNKLCWQTKTGETYDLWRSDDLAFWIHVDGYPKPGTGGVMEHPFTAGRRGFFKITLGAPVPAGFALIPAGSFQMGDQSDPLVGWSGERPVHAVQVSGFYMGKYEVTKEEWDAVRAWALNQHYTDLSAGNGTYAAKGANHPVHSISWYDAAKWCNARSEKEGLTPCYTVGGATYKTGFSDAVVCNWSANGYRLPSEAEWEKAARGGLSGQNFPWGNTIRASQANYYSDSYFAYDVSRTRSYHPSYKTGGYPYSSPVGSFAPNGYGLYDMAGNMHEWCWDWWGPYAAGSQTDSRGATSGSNRVRRGGSWYGNADYCRVADRRSHYPGYGNLSIGFRVARSSVPWQQQERTQ